MFARLAKPVCRTAIRRGFKPKTFPLSTFHARSFHPTLFSRNINENKNKNQNVKKNNTVWYSIITLTVGSLILYYYLYREQQNFEKNLVEGEFSNILKQKKIGNCAIQIAMGDLTDETTDAIVNAANEHLSHGGGVARAIVVKGGQIIQEESNAWIAKYGPVRTGETAITGAGKLKCKYVIHTVGPRWKDGKSNEDTLLRNALYNSLKRAEEYHLKSISIPAISSGIFGFPKERCAQILLDTAVQYLKDYPNSEIEIIRFINFDNPTVEVFVEAFKQKWE